MMANPKVSILLPMYNAAATVVDAVNSIRTQSLREWELIVVDDGSDDDSVNLLQQTVGDDHRIRLLQLDHGGLVTALNTGLRKCRAPFTARMDADDVAYPERLRRQVRMLEDDPSLGVVGCQVEGFPLEEVGVGFQIYLDWQNRLLTHDDIIKEIFIESPITHPSACLRTALLLEAGGYEEHGWPEDYDLWLRLAATGVRFGKVNEVLLSWREHVNRLTRTDSRYSVENFLRAKAHYLTAGPLRNRDSVFVWGAGKTGRRLSKHLIRNGTSLVAFVDIDVAKIGRTMRQVPIVSTHDFSTLWRTCQNPFLLCAVASRGARAEIRGILESMELREGYDYFNVA